MTGTGRYPPDHRNTPMPPLRTYHSVFFAAGLLLANISSLHSQTPAMTYGGSGQAVPEPDIEYGIMHYSSAPRTDPVTSVDPSRLRFQSGRGYLDSLLQALGISPTSQILVFSRTSLNVGNITPRTPRAIYFNDQTYVAWVPGSDSIEIASMDPGLGQVFYTLEQTPGAGFGQQTAQCLRCHDSYTLTGGGVPRFILGSGYTGANGNLVSHEGWILTSPSTPLQSRWGGWYVTGRHGKQVHLGNIVVTDPADLYQLDSLRKGNIDNLEALIDTDPYLTRYSDIVALLVIEHQVEVQNLITRVNYDLRTALADHPELLSAPGLHILSVAAPIRQLVENMAEPLVRAMMMVDEQPLTNTVSGESGYSKWFQNQGPRDSRQRSLRKLDLQTRLFRYPVSYLVYSDAFNALPLLARQQVYLRLRELLDGGQLPEGYGRLAEFDREATLSILNETVPEFSRSGPPIAD